MREVWKDTLLFLAAVAIAMAANYYLVNYRSAQPPPPAEQQKPK
jgi:hypothetical protein